MITEGKIVECEKCKGSGRLRVLTCRNDYGDTYTPTSVFFDCYSCKKEEEEQ